MLSSSDKLANEEFVNILNGLKTVHSSKDHDVPVFVVFYRSHYWCRWRGRNFYQVKPFLSPEQDWFGMNLKSNALKFTVAVT